MDLTLTVAAKRLRTEAEEATKSWCKVMDALGDVFMSKYRADCLEYTKE